MPEVQTPAVAVHEPVAENEPVRLVGSHAMKLGDVTVPEMLNDRLSEIVAPEIGAGRVTPVITTPDILDLLRKLALPGAMPA